MTSPVGGKPESTQDRYDDVHSVGSSFGAELDENAVRNLLGNQVENPFASIVTGLAGTVVGILESVANGILGIFKPGDRESPIRDAIVAVMEPMESQVLDLGKRLNAMSTEVMGKIEEQKGLIDDATSAVNEAKDAVAAVKAVADQNKKDVAAAISKAEKASADLAALAPQITAAIDAANKASSDVSTLTPKVTAAKEEAAKASQDIAALSPKVSDAVSKSDKATKDVAALTPKVTAASNKATQAASDVADLTPKVTAAQDKADKAASDLTTLTPKVTAAQRRADAAYTEAGKVRTELSPKITAAQNQADAAVADLAELEPKVTAAQSKADSAFTEAGKVRNEVTPKIEAAQIKGETALATADKAIADSEFVAGFADDLIPKDENGKSTWSQGMANIDVSPEGSAFGSERTFLMDDSFTFPVAFNPVKGQEVYRLTVWIYRDPDSRSGGFSFHVVDNDGQRRWEEARLNLGEWRPLADRTNLFTTVNFDTWEKHVIDFRWPEHLGPARIRFQLNKDSKFYVHDPQVRVIQPLDNSVDQAQNDAIRANTEVLRQQQEINAAQATANLAQKNFNDNQQKWNTASSNATKALQDSAALQALLNDAQADINAHQKIFNDNQIKWNTASTNATKALADAAKAQKDINAEQAKFNTFQTDFNKKQTTWNKASSDATKALQDVAKAQKDINAEQQKFNNFQTDFNKKQTAWNNAVDRSIATQKTVNDNFEKWTDGATKAITANADATEALARINGIQIGGRNLLVNSYLNKTSSEYLHSRIPLGDSKPETGEIVTISLKATPGEGNTRFRFYNSRGNGSDFLFDLYINEQEPSPDGVYKATGEWKVAAKNSHLNVYAYPSSVKTPSEIEWVKLERGNTATDWTPAPEDLPTQAQVDDAQNKAIQANTEFAKQQIEVNNLFQEQMWTQLDMIEQGEIQRSRVYHQNVEDGPLISNIPSWVGWKTAREYKNTFINFYHRYSDTKRVYWQATGSWEGQLKVTMTWDNGAVDVWVYDVYKDRITRGDKTWSGRTFSNAGGASFVYHRNTTFEVYPRNLGRQVGVFISTKDDGTGTRWVDEDAPSINQPSMIRYKSEDMFRLAASVTSDKEVTTRVYQDGEWVKKVYAPDTIIPPSMIWREDMPTGMTYFMETNFYDKTLK